MRAWKTLSSEDIYETPWIKVRRDQVVNANNKEFTYSVIDVRPGVLMLAFNKTGELFVIKNDRYAPGKTLVEIPGGFCEDQEDALTAAKRELMEETGLASDDWTELPSLYPAPGYSSACDTFFLARNAYQAEGELDKDEPVTHGKFMPISELEALARAGKIQNMHLLAGVYLAKLHGL